MKINIYFKTTYREKTLKSYVFIAMCPVLVQYRWREELCSCTVSLCMLSQSYLDCMFSSGVPFFSFRMLFHSIVFRILTRFRFRIILKQIMDGHRLEWYLCLHSTMLRKYIIWKLCRMSVQFNLLWPCITCDSS